MARKKEKNYFEMMREAMRSACTVSDMLSKLVSDMHAGISDVEFEKKLNAMHEEEHRGDLVHYEIINELNRAFITPIDREDILIVSDGIDKITDEIENVAFHIWIFNIRKLRIEIDEFVSLMKECCVKCSEILDEFENFRKSGKLMELIREMDDLEHKGDMLYGRAVRQLFTTEMDPVEIQKWRELYHNMEECFDTCKDMAQAVGNAVVKNS